MAYRVDFKRLRGLRGSRDSMLLARVIELANEHGAQIDDDEEDASEGDSSREDLELAAARRFLNGEPPDPAALEAHEQVMGIFCTLCSQPLEDGLLRLKSIQAKIDEADALHWRDPDRFLIKQRVGDESVEAHVRELEDALDRHGVSDRLALRQLFLGGTPMSPPKPPGPAYSWSGYLTPEMVRRARGALRPQEWKDLTKEVRAMLSLLDKGIEAAAGRGHGLRCVWIESIAVTLDTFDFARLESLRGSRSEAFLERFRFFVEQKQAYTKDVHALSDAAFVQWKRQNYPEQPEDTEPAPDLPAVPRAAWEILHRTRLDSDRADLYVHALHLMCMAIGTPLDNSAVAPANPSHFEAVEEALEARGLKERVSMQKLVFGGPPIAIPCTDEFPTIGYLSPRTVKAARGLIAQHDWSASPLEV